MAKSILASVGLALATSRRARPVDQASQQGEKGKLSFWHWRKARLPSLALRGADTAAPGAGAAETDVQEER